MANQQKQAQQETAYMVHHMYPCPPLHVSMTPFGSKTMKNRGYIQLHHIGSLLLHLLLLIYHPYTPSFHEMIFILVPAIISLGAVNLERQCAPKCIVTYACAIAKTAPLFVTRAMASFQGQFWIYT